MTFFIKKLEKRIFEIINEIPFFAWLIFILLLVGGVQASKKNAVSIISLVLIPCIFTTWSFSSFASKYAIGPLAILLWHLCFTLGFVIGYVQMKKNSLQFDKIRMNVEFPGSWLPLLLSMSIYATKFSIEMTSAILPHLRESFLFFALELFSTSLLGIFAGRGINCFIRYISFTPSPK